MGSVKAGQQWRPPKAVQQNGWDAAAQDYSRRVLSDPKGIWAEYWPVKLQNVSGAARRQYEVVSLDGTFLLDPVTRQNIWLEGDVASTPQRLFGVLLEAAKDDAIVRAQISGVCPALVNVTNDGHRRATLIASEDRFTSSVGGPVQIIHKPTGTGEKLCVVNLSNRTGVKLYGMTPAGGIPAATKSSDTISPGSSAVVEMWYYDWATADYIPMVNSSAVQLTETVYNPWPTDISGDRWISFSEDDDGLLTVDNEACEEFA